MMTNHPLNDLGLMTYEPKVDWSSLMVLDRLFLTHYDFVL